MLHLRDSHQHALLLSLWSRPPKLLTRYEIPRTQHGVSSTSLRSSLRFRFGRSRLSTSNTLVRQCVPLAPRSQGHDRRRRPGITNTATILMLQLETDDDRVRGTARRARIGIAERSGGPMEYSVPGMRPIADALATLAFSGVTVMGNHPTPRQTSFGTERRWNSAAHRRRRSGGLCSSIPLRTVERRLSTIEA